ncbi:MAPEG family protein [Oceanicella actignis]|uniref:MAPEG family protein n=1 Tax=Oceanicella actignis TaxID=1189325 RepID=UPI0011E6A32A|nr:MAPEG family protein [Oceanicella actignis]TYO89519.1 hypothetical protein LY05_01508 [Oceanicella actignis]
MTDPTPVAAVALYAGLNGLILAWMVIAIVRLRVRLGVYFGDGGHAILARAMRGQANFIEFTPMCLILLLMMAMLGAPLWVLHLFGATLTLGRLLHAMHFMAADAPAWQRSVGATLSLAVLVLGALGVAGHALAAM